MHPFWQSVLLAFMESEAALSQALGQAFILSLWQCLSKVL